MAPVNLDEETRRIILNGPRPSPLKLHNSSHIIQKQVSKNTSIPPKGNQQIPKANAHRIKPVIIYTHSPKIIHTRPKDFKDLVQKLTGFSRSEDFQAGESSSVTVVKDDGKAYSGENNGGFSLNHEENETSCDTNDHVKFEGGNNKDISSSLSNPYLAEMPIFTPNSSNLFTSSQPTGLRHLDSVFPSPGLISLVGSISPSFLEFMKGFQEK